MWAYNDHTIFFITNQINHCFYYKLTGLQLSIECFQLQQLLYTLGCLVRDSDAHPCFQTGMKWWIPYRTNKIKKLYPKSLSIQEQIQVSLNDFNWCFGETFFPDFQFNRCKSVYFMTINVAHEQDGYGMLILHHIIKKKTVHNVNDWISYTNLPLDLLLDTISKLSMFDMNMFLHLKKYASIWWAWSHFQK